MSVSNKAIAALQSLPFGNLIGGPLSACIDAQADAAQSSIGFIRDVGLQTPLDVKGNPVPDADGVVRQEAVYVYFQFIQNGRKVIISVPLLTIIPIPYIAISTVDINFKATVTGMDKETYEDDYSWERKRNVSATGKVGKDKVKTTLNTSISTKKDSKATQESSYSIEATIDVNVHASQDSMPAGMAKILELLGSAMDLCDPNGELTVSDAILTAGETGKAELSVTWKTPGGLYDPSYISIAPAATDTSKSVDEVIYTLSPGTYTIKAGAKESKVTVNPATPPAK
jgi:hypothetical protein